MQFRSFDSLTEFYNKNVEEEIFDAMEPFLYTPNIKIPFSEKIVDKRKKSVQKIKV